MGGNHLLSKILAGGLSAGVFLMWWPGHFPDAGMQWLVLRGVLWTLTFEVLLLSIAPVETLAGAQLRTPAAAPLADRRPLLDARGRAGWTVGVACAAVAVPALLLTEVQPRPADAHPVTRERVVQKVIVRRPVVRREVVVREVRVPGTAVPERVVRPVAS